MPKIHWIRTVYLYVFSVVGIILIIIGSVSFLDMALKAWVFTQADEDRRINFDRPPLSLAPERAKELADEDAGDLDLTEAEQQQIARMLAQFEVWQERRDAVDPVTADRHRTAARNLAMMLVGLPLYLYHWATIRKEGAGFVSKKQS